MTEKNEITREFEKIMADRSDPDSKERQRIKKLREDRLDKEDVGL